MNKPHSNSPRDRLKQLLAIPERQRTEEEWDELNELEIMFAAGNRDTGQGGYRDGGHDGRGNRDPGHGQRGANPQQQGQGQRKPDGGPGGGPGGGARKGQRKFHKKPKKPNNPQR